MFDFDRVIERRGTHSSKWDNIARLSGIKSPDAIPMWVADMDFAAPPGVTSALTGEIQQAVHGYYADTGSWAAALADWMARRHDLLVDPNWVSPTPGIVSGLGLILQAVSAPGDEVVVFPPAYHAFRRIIVANKRRILDAQLVETVGRYAMDLDALIEHIAALGKITQQFIKPRFTRPPSRLGRDHAESVVGTKPARRNACIEPALQRGIRGEARAHMRAGEIERLGRGDARDQAICDLGRGRDCRRVL